VRNVLFMSRPNSGGVRVRVCFFFFITVLFGQQRP
jgi:hypothetical protein